MLLRNKDNLVVRETNRKKCDKVATESEIRDIFRENTIKQRQRMNKHLLSAQGKEGHFRKKSNCPGRKW